MERVNKNEKRNRKAGIWIVLAVGLVILAAIVVMQVIRFAGNEYCLELSLRGETHVTVEYGDIYTDAGAEAVGYGTFLHKEKLKLDVEVDGEVNSKKLGSYTLYYTATYQGQTATQKRTVDVVDTQAPKIDLISDPDYFTIPGQEYEEQGFTATDNYDGDITDRVERRLETGRVVYTVEDSSGNRAEITRVIVYHDPEPPQLTLKGDEQITIGVGTNWTEPGYTAADNVDGDLTANVTVSGEVDINTVGTYELTYEVTDSYGNKSVVKRSVRVKVFLQQNIVQPEGKVIYLTFDDGPGIYTEKLLSILEKYNVKATFFVVNTQYLDLLDDIVEGGHAIGIHSKSHRYEKIYASEENFFDDLYAMQDIIYQHTGVKTMLMRFPGGSSNRASLKYNQGIMTRLTQEVQDRGFRYFDWDVVSGDAGETENTDQIVKNVIKGIQKNTEDYSVILQHDIKGFSVDAVEQIIIWGLENGYTFLPLGMDSPICQHTVKN